MYLLIAAGLFSIFFANVVLGAFADAAFLGDVNEMLVLFASSIAFTVTILKAENAKKKSKN